MAFRIYIPKYCGEAGPKYLKEKGYDVIATDNNVCDPKEMALCDGILARAKPMYDKDLLKDASRLKVISRYGVGVDNVDLAYCTGRGIQVTNTPTSNYISVAEHAMMMILQCAKNVTEVNKLFCGESRDFNCRNTNYGYEVMGKTLGIIGLGRIGKALARMASGFEMKIICYDPFLSPENIPSGIIPCARDEVIRQSDFLSIHLPCTNETRYSFGMKEFKQMKPTAHLINCSRGMVVNELEMIEALNRKIIAGAGVDVFEAEPPAKDNPLFSMTNVVLSPHIAAMTYEASERMSLHAAMGVDEVLTGKTPTWPVNKI